jgi:hypothetical protein
MGMSLAENSYICSQACEPLTQQPTTKQQPTTNNQQPTAYNQQPTNHLTNNQQPTFT